MNILEIRQILIVLMLSLILSGCDGFESATGTGEFLFCSNCCTFDTSTSGIGVGNSACVAESNPEAACSTLSNGAGGVNVQLLDPNATGSNKISDVAGCVVEHRYRGTPTFKFSTKDNLQTVSQKRKVFKTKLAALTDSSVEDKLQQCKADCSQVSFACHEIENGTPGWKIKIVQSLAENNETALIQFLESTFSVDDVCKSKVIDDSGSTLEIERSEACASRGQITFGEISDPLSETLPMWLVNPELVEYSYTKHGKERTYTNVVNDRVISSASIGLTDGRSDLLFLDANIQGVHINDDGSGEIFLNSVHPMEGETCLRVK